MQLTKRVTRALLAPPTLMMLVLLILPMILIVRFSFGERSTTDFATDVLTGANYAELFTNTYTFNAILRTFIVSFIGTVIALVLALPIAFYISRASERLRSLLTIWIIFPILAGSVVLSVGWVTILSSAGIVSTLAQQLFDTNRPLQFMQTVPTVSALMVIALLPIMVISLQSSVDAVPADTERAALSLGASPCRTFFRVLLPQIVPGITAGCSLTFVLMVNAYVVPTLIGGGRVPMIAPEIYSAITNDNNWPAGSALAVFTFVASLSLTALFSAVMRRRFESWRVQ